MRKLLYRNEKHQEIGRVIKNLWNLRKELLDKQDKNPNSHPTQGGLDTRQGINPSQGGHVTGQSINPSQGGHVTGQRLNPSQGGHVTG